MIDAWKRREVEFDDSGMTKGLGGSFMSMLTRGGLVADFLV
jgi:hypothetical protein